MNANHVTINSNLESVILRIHEMHVSFYCLGMELTTVLRSFYCFGITWLVITLNKAMLLC